VAILLGGAAEAPPELLRRAELLPPTGGFAVVKQSAVCAFAPEVRHLDPLPSAQPWARPNAIVVFDGLPAQPPGTRAVLMRPTREALARKVVADALAEGSAQLRDRRLEPLPPGGDGGAAYIAIPVAPPPPSAAATRRCVAQGSRP
jgi:hypothetical protein